MYKDFVNVTPESGGAGTTPIAVAADENEGAARSTSLNITDGVFMKKWLLLPLLKMKILFMILQDSLKNLGLQKLVSGK